MKTHAADPGNHETNLISQLSKLAKHRLRLTGQRKAMIELVMHSNKPLTAVDMYHSLEQRFPGLSYATVYQNIKLFIELRILESFILGDEVRFRICTDQEHPRYHLICMDCERTFSLDMKMERMRFPLKSKGFQPISYKFDVYGYCTDCRDL
ncbi:Fur family transcriptional regulator [Paenibacillus planticolens]|uniref:Transcriptional repressor n=1 Tax=Paenibacillus planticolens TaxID=2654976 RepID=A0ABX1ZKJ6_9BACL|nr:Fur family transcriptional regulator [Paenibacillus planticolens]NOV00617.1 transcriptional repressor [Paenibacillus planticolens]